MRGHGGLLLLLLLLLLTCLLIINPLLNILVEEHLLLLDLRVILSLFLGHGVSIHQGLLVGHGLHWEHVILHLVLHLLRLILILP